MADITKLAPKILQWEGGFVNDPTDRGGATNKGVTLDTWRQCGYDKDGDGDIDVDDIKLLSVADATLVLKKYYWDRWRADQIINQSIAEILVDWVWGSGKWGIMIPQRILKVDDDGIVGEKTIEALNNFDQADFHAKVKEARISFINSLILHHPEQEKFRKGWTNRINSYQYSAI